MNYNQMQDGDTENPYDVKTTLVSRNITVCGRRTSVRLEPEMWASLHDIARRERCTIHDICTLVSMRKKEKTSLTAAIRVFLMLYFRAAATEDGHSMAGHGSFSQMLSRARVSSESNKATNGERASYTPAMMRKVDVEQAVGR